MSPADRAVNMNLRFCSSIRHRKSLLRNARIASEAHMIPMIGHASVACASAHQFGDPVSEAAFRRYTSRSSCRNLDRGPFGRGGRAGIVICFASGGGGTQGTPMLTALRIPSLCSARSHVGLLGQSSTWPIRWWREPTPVWHAAEARPLQKGCGFPRVRAGER